MSAGSSEEFTGATVANFFELVALSLISKNAPSCHVAAAITLHYCQ